MATDTALQMRVPRRWPTRAPLQRCTSPEAHAAAQGNQRGAARGPARAQRWACRRASPGEGRCEPRATQSGGGGDLDRMLPVVGCGHTEAVLRARVGHDAMWGLSTQGSGRICTMADRRWVPSLSVPRRPTPCEIKRLQWNELQRVRSSDLSYMPPCSRGASRCSLLFSAGAPRLASNGAGRPPEV